MKTSSDNINPGLPARLGRLRRKLVLGLGLLMALAAAQSARAGFHLWNIAEIYSNGDGSVQFMELIETSGGFGGQNPIASGTMSIRIESPGSATNTYVFPTNLPAGSANKTFLMGTAKLASSPGGVVPNYIVPEKFIPLNGGSIYFRQTGGTPYDLATYGPVATNGDSGMFRTGGIYAGVLFSVATNSPRNYSNQSNSIVPVTSIPASKVGSNLVISFRTATGVNGSTGPNYAIEGSGPVNPAAWAVVTNVAGNGTTKSVAIPIIPETNQVFRLRVP